MPHSGSEGQDDDDRAISAPTSYSLWLPCPHIHLLRWSSTLNREALYLLDVILEANCTYKSKHRTSKRDKSLKPNIHKHRSYQSWPEWLENNTWRPSVGWNHKTQLHVSSCLHKTLCKKQHLTQCYANGERESDVFFKNRLTPQTQDLEQNNQVSLEPNLCL